MTTPDGYSGAAAVWVTDHAMWRAAERFRGFDTVLIEQEVREALAAGRVSTSRGHLDLDDRDDPTNLYVWTPDRQRIYALRHDDEAFIVVTTFKAGSARVPATNRGRYRWPLVQRPAGNDAAGTSRRRRP